MNKTVIYKNKVINVFEEHDGSYLGYDVFTDEYTSAPKNQAHELTQTIFNLFKDKKALIKTLMHITNNNNKQMEVLIGSTPRTIFRYKANLNKEEQ